jgi:hypothetical protein
MQLAAIAEDFAESLRKVDERRPTALNARSKQPFRAGIGPHSEAAAVRLVAADMIERHADRYGAAPLGVPYPNAPRQKCDVQISCVDGTVWNIEVKLLRLAGDNGQPNDNMLMHILSPYPAHRSALTDCVKLLASGLPGSKAIMIYGFEHDELPLDLAVDAFEVLARARVALGTRHEYAMGKLMHPVHAAGRVFAWELLP